MLNNGFFFRIFKSFERTEEMGWHVKTEEGNGWLDWSNEISSQCFATRDRQMPVDSLPTSHNLRQQCPLLHKLNYGLNFKRSAQRTALHFYSIIHNAVPVAARAKAWVCSCSLAGIAGSNPTGGMDICHLWMLCVVQLEVSAIGRSLVQGSPNECVCACVSLSVISCNNQPLHLQ
jgi:hypothetical protein